MEPAFFVVFYRVAIFRRLKEIDLLSLAVAGVAKGHHFSPHFGIGLQTVEAPKDFTLQNRALQVFDFYKIAS